MEYEYRNYLPPQTRMDELYPGMSPLARNLKYMRAVNNLSQGLLAKRSGVCINTIVRIEKGVGYPRMDTLKLIARELQCKPEELMRGEE